MSQSTRNSRKHAARKERRNALLLATLPTIDDWCLIEDRGDMILEGRAYNDARFPDGALVSTSELARIDHLTAVTARGTKYRLGTPSKDYMLHREQHGLGPITTKVFYFNRSN